MAAMYVCTSTLGGIATIPSLRRSTVNAVRYYDGCNTFTVDFDSREA